MEIQVVQITVLVADMDESIRFYRDRLGLTPVEVSAHWSEFEAGPVHIALHPGRTGTDSTLEGGTDAGTVNIVLHVPDLEAGCQSLRARGVDVNGPFEMEGLPPLATFNDPDGISFTLTARSNS